MQRSRGIVAAATLIMGLGGLGACKPWSCFIAGTPISTPEGVIPIEDVRIGQRVYSYDQASGQVVIGTVSRVFIHEDMSYGKLVISDGRHLGITAEHPVYLPTQQSYVDAQALQAGQALLLLDCGGSQPTLRRETVAQALQEGALRATVYNFSVERFENYFANGVLVHNKSPLCDEKCQSSYSAELVLIHTGDGNGTTLFDGGSCTKSTCEFTVDLYPRRDSSYLYAIGAQPDATSRFDGWGELCSGFDDCLISLDRHSPPHLVSAQFSRCQSGEWCARRTSFELKTREFRGVLVLSPENTLLFTDSPNMPDPNSVSPSLWRLDGTWLVPGEKTVQKPLLAAWARSANSAWAVGRAGTIVSWNGTAWNPVDSRTTNDLHGTWGDASNTWAVGKAGTILHSNDTLFTAVASGTSVDLNAIWGSDVGSIWAVGAQGTILRWNGATWSPSNSGTTRDLYAIWGRSSTDVWAVGAAGTILHWDGSSWTMVPSSSTADLLHIGSSGTVELLASGRGGALLRFSGVAWNSIDSGTTADLYATWQSADGRTHAVAGDQVRTLIP